MTGLFVDIFVGLVLLASVGIAFLRGFIREVLTIFGIVGGLIAAYIGGPLLAPMMRGWIGYHETAEPPQEFLGVLPYPLLADILAYGLILVVFIIMLSIISHFIAEFAKNLGLGALDRTLGVVFGIARGALVLGLLYLPFFYIADKEQKDEWFEGSHTQIYLEATSKWISGFIPSTAQEKIEESAKSIEEGSETRKKLQEMGVLQSDNQPSDDAALKEPTEPNKDGYSDEFRNKMDELFEKKAEEPAENSAPSPTIE